MRKPLPNVSLQFPALTGLVSLAVTLMAPQHVIAANAPVVTIKPSCPQWQTAATPGQPMVPPTIIIRYNPKSPAALFTSSDKVRLVLAGSININRFDSVTIPLIHTGDGSLQAAYTPKKNYSMGYSIFFLQSETGQVDNNQNQYYEILNCAGSQLNPYAVDAQALTFEGFLLAPGIQRTPDLARAIAIIKNDLAVRPKMASHYSFLWDLELQQGARTPAAYQQIGNELNAFLDSYGTDFRAMQEVAGFVTGNQKQLPSVVIERYRAALIALPETSDPFEINAVTKETIRIPRAVFAPRAQKTVNRILADFEYNAIEPENGVAQKTIGDYLAFAAKYPTSTQRSAAFAEAFRLQEQFGDPVAQESIFEKWMSVQPADVFPLLQMAQFYIDHKIKPAHALELLNSAEQLYTESERPSSHQHFHRDAGKLESLRGQAHLLLMDLPASRADFETALKAAPDNPDIAFALGKVCEQIGDKTGALAAYLAAASTPYQKESLPHESYVRLFVAQRLGSERAAEESIRKRVAGQARATATDYTPLPLNRPAPEFAFTDLAGKRFNRQSAKGKPTVITFWGIWCAPCITELPAIRDFQSRHPNANTLAVEIGDKPEKIRAFLVAHKLAGLHVAAQADWPQEFGLAAAPMTVVIDRFGQIQFLHSGLIASVEAILGKDLSALPALLNPQHPQ